MACGDETLTANTYRNVTVDIEGQMYSIEFQALSELNEDVILGTPFLENNKVVLDYSRKCLYVGHELRQIIYWDQSNQLQNEMTNLPDDLILPQEFLETLHPIFNRYADIFSEILGPATTTTTKHIIRVNSDKRVNIRPYPMSPDKRKTLYSQVQEMLERGVISPSSSPYSSPPVLVERPGKKARFCIDFRAINEITVDEAALLPKISETLKDFGDATYFTTLDLVSGYWQIPLDEESKKFTAFSTPDGAHFAFNVMPFGLKCASATFQNLMTREVLTGYLHDFTKVYLDDIIIYSNSLEEHASHLAKVFERLRLHNLKVSPEKCKVARRELEFLGHKISGKLTTPLEKHTLIIRNFPRPQNKRQLQSFLGTINWIREYIPKAAELITPLTTLLQKDIKFKWTDACTEAFESIKEATSQPLCLHRPDHNKKFFLQTDASSIGISAVLFQKDENDKREIISYSSNTLSATERRYHINEAEVLAAVTGIKKYREYLTDRPFTLVTDSRALLWLNKNRDSKSKLMRWSLLLQEYSFDVVHTPGKENQLADFLSRNPNEKEASDLPTEQRLLLPDFLKVTQKISKGQQKDSQVTQTFSEGQRQNSKVKQIGLQHENFISGVKEYEQISLLDNAELYNKVVRAQRRSRQISRDKLLWMDIQRNGPQDDREARALRQYVVEDDLLWRRHENGDKLVLPNRYAARIISQYHDTQESAHPGTAETVRAIQRFYHHRNLNRKVATYVRNCIICSAVKSNKKQPNAPLKPRSPKFPFETISIDILGPYKKQRGGNRFVIIAEDLFTKWVEAVPSRDADRNAVCNFLENKIFTRYGAPKTIISDNGPAFISHKYEQLCTKYHIHMYKTPIYHQRANCVERRVQEFKKIIRTLLVNEHNKDKWEIHIESALRIMRSRKNSATGITPAKALFGFEIPKAGEWDIAAYRKERNADAARQRDRRRVIRRRQLQFNRQNYERNPQPPRVYQQGERVMVKEMRPYMGEFYPKWSGPHIITEKLSNETYHVDRDGFIVQLHVDKIRPAPIGNPDISDSPDSVSSYRSTDEEDQTDNVSTASADETEDEEPSRPSSPVPSPPGASQERDVPSEAAEDDNPIQTQSQERDDPTVSHASDTDMMARAPSSHPADSQDRIEPSQGRDNLDSQSAVSTSGIGGFISQGETSASRSVPTTTQTIPHIIPTSSTSHRWGRRRRVRVIRDRSPETIPTSDGTE